MSAATGYFIQIIIRGKTKEIIIKICSLWRCWDVKADIEGGEGKFGRRRLITDVDWLEHHAKYFSAAILMPKTSFCHAVSELTGKGLLEETELSEELAVIFQVSPASVKIRLQQLGINQMINKHERSQDERQFKPLFQLPGTL